MVGDEEERGELAPEEEDVEGRRYESLSSSLGGFCGRRWWVGRGWSVSERVFHQPIMKAEDRGRRRWRAEWKKFGVGGRRGRLGKWNYMAGVLVRCYRGRHPGVTLVFRYSGGS